MDRLARPRPFRRTTALLRARALVRRHQPADAVRAPPRTRGRRHRRTAELRGVAATRRVRADGDGRRPPADYRGDAPLRSLLARCRGVARDAGWRTWRLRRRVRLNSVEFPATLCIRPVVEG